MQNVQPFCQHPPPHDRLCQPPHYWSHQVTRGDKHGEKEILEKKVFTTQLHPAWWDTICLPRGSIISSTLEVALPLVNYSPTTSLSCYFLRFRVSRHFRSYKEKIIKERKKEHISKYLFPSWRLYHLWVQLQELVHMFSIYPDTGVPVGPVYHVTFHLSFFYARTRVSNCQA